MKKTVTIAVLSISLAGTFLLKQSTLFNSDDEPLVKQERNEHLPLVDRDAARVFSDRIERGFDRSFSASEQVQFDGIPVIGTFGISGGGEFSDRNLQCVRGLEARRDLQFKLYSVDQITQQQSC